MGLRSVWFGLLGAQPLLWLAFVSSISTCLPRHFTVLVQSNETRMATLGIYYFCFVSLILGVREVLMILLDPEGWDAAKILALLFIHWLKESPCIYLGMVSGGSTLLLAVMLDSNILNKVVKDQGELEVVGRDLALLRSHGLGPY